MVRARSPRFFFFLYGSFFLSSFPSSFQSTWRRGFAATPSFLFLLLFIFLFFLFVFFFLFFFFLLLFLLFLFFLLLLSLPSLFFLFVFLLSFYLCFSFSFFCLSFCFTFLPSSLQALSSLSNRSPTIHFFSSAANLSHFFQPLPGSSKKKKNIGKRIHGGEMASRKRTGSGRKCRGTEWSPEMDGNVYYARRDKG